MHQKNSQGGSAGGSARQAGEPRERRESGYGKHDQARRIGGSQPQCDGPTRALVDGIEGIAAFRGRSGAAAVGSRTGFVGHTPDRIDPCRECDPRIGESSKDRERDFPTDDQSFHDARHAARDDPTDLPCHTGSLGKAGAFDHAYLAPICPPSDAPHNAEDRINPGDAHPGRIGPTRADSIEWLSRCDRRPPDSPPDSLYTCGQTRGCAAHGAPACSPALRHERSAGPKTDAAQGRLTGEAVAAHDPSAVHA